MSYQSVSLARSVFAPCVRARLQQQQEQHRLAPTSLCWSSSQQDEQNRTMDKESGRIQMGRLTDAMIFLFCFRLRPDGRHRLAFIPFRDSNPNPLSQPCAVPRRLVYPRLLRLPHARAMDEI